jgi:hypothetical protein
MKTKGLGIPSFVFTDISNSSSIVGTKSYIFVDLFSKGSLRQVSSVDYSVKINSGLMYWNIPGTSTKEITKEYQWVSLLNRGDVISSEGIYRIFYIRISVDDNDRKVHKLSKTYNYQKTT